MSGTDSSAPAAADPVAPLNLGIVSLPLPHEAVSARRTARGRQLMFAVLFVCALPVIASYFTYFVVRPQARSNYSDLVAPRPVPTDLSLSDPAGWPVAAGSLAGQWLLVVVSGGACDSRCEHRLWLQRQLHETFGRDKDRVDKLWLIDDGVAPRPETLAAIGPAARVLRVRAGDLARWLEPASGRRLEDHLYIVDPRGDWMMRTPADPEPARLKRDMEKLLRASAGWDRAGR